MIIIDKMVKQDMLCLMKHVRVLENRNSSARGQQVQFALEALGIEATVQECQHPRIKNIIVDPLSSSEEKRLLFSVHYDAVKGNPAANDNASGVAVLLGLCQQLRSIQALVRVVFFDREEAWFRTPFVRLGLLGSLYYVLRNDLRTIEAVYNLEFCGLGDSLSIWPVKNKQKDLLAVRSAEKAAVGLKLNVKSAHVPGFLLSSDHLPFRLGGVSNAVTLSLLPADQLPVLEQFVSSLSIPRMLLGRRPTMPGVLSHVHKASDDSSRLREDSLRLMLSLLVEIIQRYEYPNGRS